MTTTFFSAISHVSTVHTDTNSITFHTIREESSWRISVSGYRIDDWVTIPDSSKKKFSSLCVHTNSEAHPASYPMGTYPGMRSRMKSYNASPPWRLHGGSGTDLLLRPAKKFMKMFIR
jgi:hypothetical protein